VFVTKRQLVVVLIVILVTENVIILINMFGLYIFNYMKFKNNNTNIIVTILDDFNIYYLIKILIIILTLIICIIFSIL